MSLFKNRFSKDEILNKIVQKRKAIPFTSEYSSIPNDFILLPCLIFVICFVLPLWVASFVPIIAIYLIYKYPSILRGESPFKVTTCLLEENEVGELGTESGLATDIIPFESREYDIVVFGVTGHSGSLLAEYLIERYLKSGKGLKLAVAGRSPDKVTKSLSTLAQNTSFPEAMNIPIIIADTKDQESLNHMARNTRVVSTTVGPYLKYGEPLVKACARYGTSYNDLTGENDFVKMMRAKYGSLAKASGASLVSTSGVDSIPSDIGVLEVLKKFKESRDITPDRVDVLVESAMGGVAGGTVDTILQYMDMRLPPNYVLKNREQKGKMTTVPYLGLGYNSVAKVWCFPYIMAPINSKVVESTNTSLGHTKILHYNEAMVSPSLIANIFLSIVSLIISSIIFFYPTRQLLFQLGILPRPGVGPSRKFMASGFLAQRFIASNVNGSTEEMEFKFIGDPGGMLTALFQAEVAVSLSSRKEIVIETGAGLTPGETLDSSAFASILRDTGLIVFQ